MHCGAERESKMNNIQQEYWLANKQTIISTEGEDGVLWYQSDYVKWLEKELTALRDSRQLSAVPSHDCLVDFLHYMYENKIDIRDESNSWQTVVAKFLAARH